jgi:hypothetical protein
MKKVFMLAVAALFALALGCGGAPAEVEAPEAPEAPEVETPEAPEEPEVPLAEEEAPAEEAPAEDEGME